MDEKFAIEIFKHFSEDMDVEIRDKFIDFSHYMYYSIMTTNFWNPRVKMFFDAKDVSKYSFKELYNEMCDLFYRLDENDSSAMYDIFLLKNFANYKMTKNEEIMAGCA